MEKFKVSFEANNQQLKSIGTKHASDTYADIEAEFVLGNRWTDMDSVSAVWWNDFTRIATVLDSQGKCIVPHEVLTRKGCVRVNLVGSIVEGDELITRLTSYSAEAVQVNEKIKLTGSETSELTPSQFEQFVTEVKADADRAETVRDEAEAARNVAVSAKDTAVNAVEGFEDTVDTATAMAVQTIQGEGATQVTAIQTEGTTQVASVRTEGSTQVTAVQDKGDEVLDSIPADYTQLSQDVTNLKSDLGDNFLNNFPVINSFINSSNKWETSNAIKTTIIPTNGAKQLGIKWVNTHTFHLALLTSSSHTDGATPNFATGYSGRIVLTTDKASGTYYNIPPDCEYIYIMLYNSGTDYSPTYFMLDDVDYCESLADRIESNKKSNEDSFSFVYSDMGAVYGEEIIIPHIKEWIEGEYIKTDDGTVGQSANYHRTDYIEIEPSKYSIKFTNVDTGSYDVKYNAWYDSNKAFISSFSTSRNASITIKPPSTAKYMRLSFRNTTKNTIDVVDFHTILGRFNELFVNNNIYVGEWSNNIYFYGEGTWGSRYNRLGLQNPITARTDLVVSVASGYRYGVLKFSSETISTETEVSTTGWVTNDTIVNKGDIFLINMSKTDDTAISASDASNLTFTPFVNLGNNDGSCVIASDFTRKNINVLNVGSLTYMQAFCIYDGNYYSIDGDNISVQNSSFVQTNSAVLNTGHGNSLQLGGSKYAYASGWDDNRIYKVDLENLTISSVIALPTTGYTTGVIDEARGLAYIFQRDSIPTTEAYYNFIVYDFINQQTISTRKTSVKMAAMQGCDLYCDRIICLNGLGTNEAPNGYRVFDLNGNIIAEYVLPTLSATEPEGVCINRNTNELYTSTGGKEVYKIEMA